MKLAKKPNEADLYQPVHDFLERNGYSVRSEVNGCDITATKDDELVIIELKLNFTTTLLIQATQRQKLTESVYIGIPRPAYGLGTRRGRQMSHLVRRLELGLIIIDPIAEEMEVVFHPLPFERKRDNRARRSLLREIDGRSGEYNVGGSTRTQLVTAYREKAIMIACLLREDTALSPKELRDRGAGKNTQSILQNNHYGWFERVDRGLYSLTKSGWSALETYPKIVRHFEKRIAAEMGGGKNEGNAAKSDRSN
jgi:hypothetical protein